MSSAIKLQTPITVSSEEVMRALTEQAKEVPEVGRARGQLRGISAQRAADELNLALDINVFEMLARGWASVTTVRSAVQLSAMMPGPPTIVRLEQHNVTSTPTLLLESHLGDTALPTLQLALHLIAGIEGATLAVRNGRFELLALDKASLTARLNYKKFLVKEHSTNIEGAPRDPFRHQRSVTHQRTDVDIAI
jgi:hypothetical protein